MDAAPPPMPDNLSTLSLRWRVDDEGPDRPTLQVPVDGRNPFRTIAPTWRGFDPDEILGPVSPLLPDDLGRRVAVHRCSCGIAGCGVIAPFIVLSPDGGRVSWVDARDYTGVFDGPIAASSAWDGGRVWNLSDLHFDRAQYVAEVERASRDRSWETPRRLTARLLRERIEASDLTGPPDLELGWCSPYWNGAGCVLSFTAVRGGPEPHVRQEMLWLESGHGDPVEAAEDMLEQLLAVPPGEWARLFGLPARGRPFS